MDAYIYSCPKYLLYTTEIKCAHVSALRETFNSQKRRQALLFLFIYLFLTYLLQTPVQQDTQIAMKLIQMCTQKISDYINSLSLLLVYYTVLSIIIIIQLVIIIS